MEQVHLTIVQKVLLGLLYGLMILMVIFSIIASLDKNYEGYDKCVQKKCVRKGEAFCQKAREQQNCCLGAGGQLATNSQGKFTCVFS